MQLKADLQSAKMGNRTIAEFMHSLKAKVDELSLIDAPVSDDDFTLYVLGGLSPKFRDIAASIRAQSSSISFPQLMDLLMAQEKFVEGLEDSKSDLVVSVNAAQSKPSHNQRNYSFTPYRGRGGRGRNGGGRGGGRGSGTSHGTGSSNQNQRIICQLCETPGHTAKTCRKFSSLGMPVANVARSPNDSTNNSWLMDSGASHHLTHDLGNLSIHSEYDGTEEVHLTDGSTMPITHTGTTSLLSPSRTFQLSDVLCVPQADHNLISVHRFTKNNNVSVEFFSNLFLVKDRTTGAPLARGKCEKGVYKLQHSPLFSAHFNSLGLRTSLQTWHSRLGHPSRRISSLIVSENKLPIIKSSMSDIPCDSCLSCKTHKLPFTDSSLLAEKPLHYIYADVWGPTHISVDGYRFYLLLVDSYTKYCWFFPMVHKSDVKSIVEKFHPLAERQFGLPIRNFYSDNGGEFVALKSYFATHGIQWLTTAPHTPEQNGIVERRHRHIVETGKALLHHAKLPPTFWSFAFQTSVYLINRLPTPVLQFLCPFEALFRCRPNYSKLRTFGCICYPWLRPYTVSKLEPASRPCIFVGYSLTQSAYKCFDPTTGKVLISRHVRFLEQAVADFSHSLPSSSSEATPSSLPLSMIRISPPVQQPEPHDAPNSPPQLPEQHSLGSDMSLAHDVAPENVPRRSSRQRTLSRQLEGFQTELLPSLHHQATANVSTKHPLPAETIPSSVSQALKISHWRQAMAEEVTALASHGTWDLVPPPENCNLVGCKWVFAVKRKPDGQVERYKARLVAKGFHQRPGVDFHETFSPVIKPVTIRTVLSFALFYKWELRQLDVSNAFLHGTLTKSVFMQQPPGFVDPNHPNHVCRLKKSLYGLRQAPRAWYQTLSSALLRFGFLQSQADHSLFIYRRQGAFLLVLVYVDDIILTGSHKAVLESLVQHLKSTFVLKDLGALTYFLGIEVSRCREGLLLSQHKYMVDLLRRHNMDGSKPVTTPMATSSNLSVSGDVDPKEYRSAIGGLQYLTMTRPDISFAVNKLAQSMSRPTANDWLGVKRIMRYLKGSIHHGLLLRCPQSLQLTAYSDSDFGGNIQDGKSTSAYIIFLDSAPLSWRSRKQTGVARSSTEAEYRALASTAAEVCWLYQLFRELGISLPSPPKLLCDNLGATRLALNPVMHSRMKHIALDLHFVRDLSKKGFFRVAYVTTIDQLADLLTKPLSRTRFSLLRSKISVADGTSILRGRIKEEMT